MPETPDFEQIARELIEHCTSVEGTVAQEIALTADRLRQVWNARGAADIALIDQTLGTLMGIQAAGPYVKNLDRALRALDR